MAIIRLDLDRETWERLVASAVAERRPIALQAEVMLRRACDLPFPYESRTVTKEASNEPA